MEFLWRAVRLLAVGTNGGIGGGACRPEISRADAGLRNMERAGAPRIAVHGQRNLEPQCLRVHVCRCRPGYAYPGDSGWPGHPRRWPGDLATIASAYVDSRIAQQRVYRAVCRFCQLSPIYYRPKQYRLRDGLVPALFDHARQQRRGLLLSDDRTLCEGWLSEECGYDPDLHHRIQ